MTPPTLSEGHRKWSFVILLFLMAFVLTAFGKLDGGNFTTICSVVGGGYLAANFGEHFVKRGDA